MKIGLKPIDYYEKCFKADYDYSDIPTLFESDSVSYGDIVMFNGKTFVICMTDPKHNFSFAKPIEINSNPEDTQNDNELECPVCGKKDQDSFELSNEDEEYECGYCGSILSFKTWVTRTFYTSVKEAATIKQVIRE